ncbi:cytidine deaminase [Vibrio sp. SM6]|uniref:Cytidine deaminase n=1 Tax=Vibrio agarilyticus TaxID=2726741 RepID=A0A7X8TQM0_9VIBR|nr:cytidine deaminase [Vibrio agarilyticus]NLS12944.1 cytidine deaminase [Vibrio agarilyticus]
MTSRFDNALAQAPALLAQHLAPIVTDSQFNASLTAAQFDTLMQQTELSDQALRVALLPFAAAYAHAPISEFLVGAIVRGLSGTLYFGANMEFTGAALSQSMHAEQSAIAHAWMKGETGLSSITINYSPCGHCRQFMNELTTADSLVVQLPERAEMTLQEYLPESFGPHSLGVVSGLMAPSDHGYSTSDSDVLIQHAIKALNKSHAPYSSNHCGVAIELESGDIFIGAYAENAAFNPSLPPLQVALTQLHLAGKRFDEIKAVALAESSTGKSSYLEATQGALDTINPDLPLSYTTV